MIGIKTIPVAIPYRLRYQNTMVSVVVYNEKAIRLKLEGKEKDILWWHS